MYFSEIDWIYVQTAENIMDKGKVKPDRTSVGLNVSVFGMSHRLPILQFALDRFSVPFLQARSFAPRIAFEELMWMLRGQTDATILQEKRIHIWDGNTSKEYLESVGKPHIEPGTIGKGYGHQFRNFNGVDQLVEVFNGLKNNPNGRRHHISLWNPADFNDMALEPCHYGYTFYHQGGKLYLQQTMRSSDWMFGFPYNIAFAAMMLIFFAKALSMKPCGVFWVGTDVHVYENQLKLATKVIDSFKRAFEYESAVFQQPTIQINRDLNSLDDILELEWTDITVEDWTKGDVFEKVEMAQ